MMAMLPPPPPTPPRPPGGRPPTPPPQTMAERVEWNPTWTYVPTKRGRHDPYLAAVAKHREAEQTWNRVCHTAMNASLLFVADGLGHSMNLGIDMQIDLWTAWNGPSPTMTTRFPDMPMQRLVWEVVRDRRLAKTPPAPTSRGVVGMYKPDALTYMRAMIPTSVEDGEESPVQYLASLVGEFKVTRLLSRGRKVVVAYDITADPDMADWLKDECESHISYSGVSETGDAVTTIVKLDSQQKWIAGSAKAVVYLISINEFCGGYLSFIMLGTKFARMLFVESANKLVVECTREFKDAHQDVVSLRGFLNIKDGFLHLPWDLAKQDGDIVAWNGWNPTAPANAPEPVDALKVLLELNKLSVDILTHHDNHTPPFGKLSPPPCDQLPALADVVGAIRAHAIEVTMHSDAKRFAVEEGMKTKPTPAIRTPKRTRQKRRKPADDGDDGDEEKNHPGSEEDTTPNRERGPPQDQGGDPGPSAPHRYYMRKRRAAAPGLATTPPSAAPSQAADPPPPDSPVDRWLRQLRAFGGNLATPPFTPERAPSVDHGVDDPPLPPTVSKPLSLTVSALERQDESEVDDATDLVDETELDDELDPKPTLARTSDLLLAIEQRHIGVAMVDASTMTSILGEISEWVRRW